jgi:hypothetical protein
LLTFVESIAQEKTSVVPLYQRQAAHKFVNHRGYQKICMDRVAASILQLVLAPTDLHQFGNFRKSLREQPYTLVESQQNALR